VKALAKVKKDQKVAQPDNSLCWHREGTCAQGKKKKPQSRSWGGGVSPMRRREYSVSVGGGQCSGAPVGVGLEKRIGVKGDQSDVRVGAEERKGGGRGERQLG